MLTPADLKGRGMENAVHIDMARGESAWTGTVEGIPRLSVWRGHSRKTGSYVHWSVDGKQCRSLEAALAVLNGAMSIEDATKEEQKPVKKISLNLQIDEVTRELNQRRGVYPRMVAKGTMKQSLADYQMERLEAVKATLEWLRENETDVRAYVAAKKERAA